MNKPQSQKDFKNYSRFLIALIIISFAVRLAIGLYSGGAESDAADYTTLAIQIVTDHDYSFLFQPDYGRQVFWLWLAVLVLFMKVLGATNSIAILTTVVFGTLSIYLFYRLLRVFWDRKVSFLISLIYSLTSVHINISHNAFYDSILLCLIFYSLENYFRFIKYNNKRHLWIAGFIACLMAFIHATGYIYIFLIWLSFPFFKKPFKVREWVSFSLAIGLLPFLQVILWIFYTGSIFPYQKIQATLTQYFGQYDIETYEIRHYVRYFLYLMISYSPLLFFSLAVFILDLRWKKDRNRIIIVLSLLALIVALIYLGINPDLLSPLVFGFCILYVFLLKRHIFQKNMLVFFFGLLGIAIFTLYLRAFPGIGYGPRQFIYPATFCLPIMWFYGERFLKKNSYIVSAVLFSYCLLFFIAFVFNLPKNKNISPPGFKATFSHFLSPALPYYERDEKHKETLSWLKKRNVSRNDFILSNIENRWLNANLNMAQNHYLKSDEKFDLQKGFSKRSLEDIWQILQKNKPRYIIWDYKQHAEEYGKIGWEGERKVTYSPEEFMQKISESYIKAAIMEDQIIIFEKKSP